MAEDRTFTLVGNFTDNITPRLNAVNSSLTRLTAQMERLRTVTQPLKNDFKQLAADSKLFSDGLSRQVSDLRQANAALRDHARELGRVNRAYRAGAGRQMPWNQPPAGASGGGGGGGRGGGANWGVAVGGSVLGNQLANIMTGAIVKGFQMGTNLMRIPFNYFVNSFAERIRDESSDIQSAGGLYAISQRKNLNMFADFQAAVKTQQQINYRLAESARALPGSTAAYVQQGKRISDTIMTAMGANAPGMQKFAEELGAKQGNKLDALGLLIQKFTEKAVLLGQGTQYRGMYGVPQLVEMLMNAPNVNEAMFNKFAVYRDMPILQSAFRDMQKDLAKTGAFTQERMRLVFELLDKALPNEVVQKHKNSMAGFLEAFKSAFLDPEVGLFGIGRKIKGIAPEVDQFGKILSGKAKADLSLYELIGQTLTGFGLPLSELVSILPQIYEPFAKIVPDLVNLRNVAQQFYYTFNQYTKDYENIAKSLGMGTALGRDMKGTAGARGALTALANLLVSFEKLPVEKFKEVTNKLKNPRFTDLGSVTKDLFSALFDSKVMRMIGETLGQMVGGTLAELGSLMGGVTGATSTGPFAEGLKAGWDQAGGTQGIATVFRSLFGLIFNVLKEAITKAPVETAGIALAFALPSLVSGALTNMAAGMLGGAGGGRRGGRRSGGVGGIGGGNALAAFFSAPGGGRASGRRGEVFMRRGGRAIYQLGAFGAEVPGFAYNAAGRPGSRMMGGLASQAGRVARYVPGAAVAGGALELGMSLASGESVGKAIAGAVGTTLFGAIGSAFGPVGTMIGMTAGSYLGGAIFDAFDPQANKQKLAAEMQVQAAADQMRAAESKSLGSRYGTVPLEYQFGDVKSLAKRLEMLNIRGAQGAAILKEYGEREVAQEALKAADREVERQRLRLQSQALPAAELERQLAPFKARAEAAARVVSKEQSDLAAALKKIPVLMRDALIQNVATLPLSQLDIALATAVTRRESLAAAAHNRAVIEAAGGRPGVGVPFIGPPLPSRLQGTRTPAEGAVNQWSGGLGDAISQELRMKPPGSNLVIANSSETIIPAAGGLGMKDFMRTLDTGFNRVAGTVQASVQNGYAGGGPMTNHFTIVQQPGQDAEELAAIVAMKIGEAVAERRSASIFI